MSEIKIPFGRAADGRMVSVDAVPRGLDCNCVCASCGARLVARKGEVNQHHFAHHIETENCVAARESSIHKFAKQVICEALELRLPDNLDLGPIQNAKSEQWLDGIRPDVLVEYDEPVAIEIFVTNSVDSDKLKKITLRKLATLEIDLSSYRNVDKTGTEWRDLVLRTAPRFWLFQPTILREMMERFAREAEERAVQEEAERQAIIDRQRQAAEYREWRRREEEEFHRLIAVEQARRKAAEFAAIAQVELERRKRSQEFFDKKERRYLASLKLCADTELHLTEWERRKALAVITDTYVMPGGHVTYDLTQAVKLWGVEFDKMLAARHQETSG
jgi:hypothetical protein